MKKLVIFTSIFSLLFALCGFLVVTEFPRIISFILTRALGAQTTVSSATITFSKGLISINMQNIVLQGSLVGSIGLWDLSIDPAEGLSVRETVISDFEITVKQLKKGGNIAVPPARFFTIQRGIVRYNEEQFQVNKLSIENMDIGKQFLFTMDLRTLSNKGRIEGSGQGIYEKRQLKMNGKVVATGMDLGKTSSRLKGICELNGDFKVHGKNVEFDGRFGLEDGVFMLDLFKNPVRLDRITGELTVALKNRNGHAKITGLKHKETLFAAEIGIQKYEVGDVVLSSGFIDVADVKHYVDLEKLIGPTFDVSSIGNEGRVRIEKLLVGTRTVYGSLELKGVSFQYEKIPIHDIQGQLRFDEKSVTLGPITGTSGASMLKDFKGQIATTGNRQMILEGEYILALPDAPAIVPGFSDLEVNLGSGYASGRMKLTSRNGQTPVITGQGSFSTPYAEWRKRGGALKGDFSFSSNGIVFTNLALTKGDTELGGRGKFEKNQIDFFIEGRLDIAHARLPVHTTMKASGVSALRLSLKRSSSFSVEGTVDLKDTSIDVPQYFRKEKGITGLAKIAFTKDAAGFSIKTFDLLMDTLSARVTGTVGKDGAINLSTNIQTDEIDRVARLFLVNDIDGKGFFKANFRIHDLRLPLDRLPSLTGSLTTRGAFLKLPWFKKPFTNINLNAEFNDDTINVAVHSLRCGKSILTSGVLNLRGIDNPRFYLAVDAEVLNPEDFQGKGPFSLRPLPRGSLLLKTKGDFLVKAKHLAFTSESGSDFEAKGSYSEGKLIVERITGNIMEGRAEVKGGLDISKTQPEVTLSGKLADVKSGLLMNILGGKAEIVEGKTLATADLWSKGQTSKEWLSNLKGSLSTLSKNGVIKRWNLLSKLFSLLTLNFYDIFRGKMDLTTEGLPFREMGASFSIDNGIFHTENFIIDSPSMMIIGEGDVNIATNDIKARIHVSPLIFVDSTIDKIPLIRTILKEKKKGFLHIAYDVTGPIDDPSMSISYVDSIGRRPIDLMRNLFLFPLEVLK